MLTVSWAEVDLNSTLPAAVKVNYPTIKLRFIVCPFTCTKSTTSVLTAEISYFTLSGVHLHTAAIEQKFS